MWAPEKGAKPYKLLQTYVWVSIYIYINVDITPKTPSYPYITSK